MIPEEVLHRVLEFLSDSQRATAALVCRDWNHTLRALVWTKVSLMGFRVAFRRIRLPALHTLCWQIADASSSSDGIVVPPAASDEMFLHMADTLHTLVLEMPIVPETVALKNLKRLSITCTSLCITSVSSIVARHPNLEQLKLHGFMAITKENVHDIFDASPALKSLSLASSGYGILSDAVTALSRGSLFELSLTNCEISEEALRILCIAHRSTLSVICLRGCGESAQFSAVLAELLPNLTRLEYLAAATSDEFALVEPLLNGQCSHEMRLITSSHGAYYRLGEAYSEALDVIDDQWTRLAVQLLTSIYTPTRFICAQFHAWMRVFGSIKCPLGATRAALIDLALDGDLVSLDYKNGVELYTKTLSR